MWQGDKRDEGSRLTDRDNLCKIPKGWEINNSDRQSDRTRLCEKRHDSTVIRRSLITLSVNCHHGAQRWLIRTRVAINPKTKKCVLSDRRGKIQGYVTWSYLRQRRKKPVENVCLHCKMINQLSKLAINFVAKEYLSTPLFTSALTDSLEKSWNFGHKDISQDQSVFVKRQPSYQIYRCTG